MPKLRLSVALLLLAPTAPAFADDTIWKQLGNDAKYIAVSPTRVEASDTPWFLGSAALMGGAFAADRSVHLALKDDVTTTHSKDFKRYGDLMQVVVPLTGAGFWATGVCNNNSYAADTGRMAVSSMLWTAVVDVGMKFATGRHRPSDTQDNPFLFTPFRNQGGFVSGHTANTFAAATIFAERYPTWKVAVPAYAAATAVGASRLFADAHWTSDVVGGALLGMGISHSIVSRHNGKPSNTQVTFDGRTLQWVRKF